MLLVTCAPASAAAPAGDLTRLAAAADPAGVILTPASGVDAAGLAAALAAPARTAFAYERLGLVVVRGAPPALLAAAQDDRVAAAHVDAALELELNVSAPYAFGGATVGAARRDALYAAGLDGSGQTVAVVDSGVDGTHRDLAARLVRNVKFAGVEGGPVTAVECPGGAPCSTDTTGGHGTAVAGVAVGDGAESNGFYRGVAPGASLVGLGVGDGPLISFALAAYEYVLAHPELGVVAVNSSFGKPQTEGTERYDPRDPVTAASKRLFDAGITPVFSAGNSGSGTPREGDPPGASDCSTQDDGAGGRRATPGAVCRSNTYSVAPWAIGVANGRKDGDHLSFSSARGDPRPQVALDGSTISYEPAITAPGTNVRSARNPTGVFGGGCGISVIEPPACTPPPGGEAYEPRYVVTSGTSFAAPHVTGAIAVVQDAAQTRLGRRLTPVEVRGVLLGSARAMPAPDVLYDFCGPNGITPGVPACGAPSAGMTGRPYERWQVGAGYLDVAAAVALVDRLPTGAGTAATGGTADDAASSSSGGPAPTAGSADATPCRDAVAPASRITSARRRGNRLTLRGTTADTGCGARVTRVRVSLARRVAGGCRPMRAGGRLGPRRSCLRTSYLDARHRGRTWSITLPVRGRGRYVAWVRAIDAAGNVERKDRGRNLRRVRL